jgi:hypothetical protein
MAGTVPAVHPADRHYILGDVFYYSTTDIPDPIPNDVTDIKEYMYNLARDKQTVLSLDEDDSRYSTIDEQELIEIAIYPPIVDYFTYLELRSQGLDEFRALYSELRIYSGIATLDETQYFFYATRGYVQGLEGSEEVLNRQKTYNSLTRKFQCLIDEIYGGKAEYCFSGYDPTLSRIVIDIDGMLDNLGYMATYCTRHGISVVIGNQVISTLETIRKLSDIVKVKPENFTVDKAIALTIEEYEEIMSDVDTGAFLEEVDTGYENRLYVLIVSMNYQFYM